MPELTIAFAGHSVEIECPNNRVHDAIQYMFQPHVIDNEAVADSKLRVSIKKASDKFLLFRGDEKLARTRNIADLFVSLYDAVIRDVISPASDGLALHAGAVCRGDTTLLIPGISGAGKSTLTSWLIANDWDYLTDELVYLVDARETEYLTRPLSIKKGAVDAVTELFNREENDELVYQSRVGIYVHPSMLEKSTTLPKPGDPSIILFPAWSEDAKYRLEPLTVAHAATRLMNVLVNARNLPSHGVPEIIRLASSVPSYRLHYSSFNQLECFEDDLVDTISAGPDTRGG